MSQECLRVKRGVVHRRGCQNPTRATRPTRNLLDGEPHHIEQRNADRAANGIRIGMCRVAGYRQCVCAGALQISGDADQFGRGVGAVPSIRCAMREGIFGLLSTIRWMWS